jgi:hypothetical protein
MLMVGGGGKLTGQAADDTGWQGGKRYLRRGWGWVTKYFNNITRHKEKLDSWYESVV